MSNLGDFKVFGTAAGAFFDDAWTSVFRPDEFWDDEDKEEDFGGQLGWFTATSWVSHLADNPIRW